MIDDQVNLEELAESRRQRDAAANAVDDGTRVEPANEGQTERSQSGVPKQWIRYARKWLDAAGSFRRS